MSKQPQQGSELSSGQAVSLAPTESELEPLANSESLPKHLTMAVLNVVSNLFLCQSFPKHPQLLHLNSEM